MRKRRYENWLVGLMAVAVFFLTAGSAAGQSANSPAKVPIPKVTGPFSSSDASHALVAARWSDPVLDLSANGYTEEEFFVSGTGNVYDWNADGTIKVRTPNLPYTTRILIRRPSDPQRFSGVVMVDLGNRPQKFDTYASWGQLHDHLIASGHVYVAVTIFAVNLQSLKSFDSTRYAPLSFPKPVEACGPANGPKPEFEDGIRFDVISQVGALLKSGSSSNPLRDYRVQYVIASMQSTGDFPTYINAIPRNFTTDSGKPVYDAYLVKDSGAAGPLNACMPRLAAGDPRAVIRNAGAPVVQIVSENSVSVAARRADSDAPGDQFRTYEIPGASHFDFWHFMYRPGLKDITATGIDMKEYFMVPRECEPRVAYDDLPQPYLWAGALTNLVQWLKTGTPMPKADVIELKPGKGDEVVTDDFGNARGGVRTPWLNVPAGTFHARSKGPGTCPNIGYWVPFSWPKLEAAYGTYDNYSRKFLADVDRLVKERWVTAADGEKIKAEFRSGEARKQSN